jgi:hypothetical protein
VKEKLHAFWRESWGDMHEENGETFDLEAQCEGPVLARIAVSPYDTHWRPELMNSVKNRFFHYVAKMPDFVR